MAQQLPNHCIDTGQCDIHALGADIEDLVAYISPAKRTQVVEALVRRLQHIVDAIWNTDDRLPIITQSVQLQLYGSSLTGLDLPASDVDLTLIHVIHAEKELNKHHAVSALRELWSDASEYRAAPSDEAWDVWDAQETSAPLAEPLPLVPNHDVLYERQIAILRQLEQEINQRGWAASCQLIRARVPIVKLQDREFGFHFDVSVEQLDGIASSTEIARALRDNTLLAPIIKILKLTLHSHDLHRPYTGGVGSYLLVLLVLHYFQLHGKHVTDTAQCADEASEKSPECADEASEKSPECADGESEVSSTRAHLSRALLGVLQWYGETLAPLSWTLHTDTGHVELHDTALVDAADHVTQSVLAPTTKHDVACSATLLPTVFAHWAELARDLRAGKALEEVVWCRSVIGSFIDKLARVSQLVGEKRTREETESEHVAKHAKLGSE